MAKDENVPPVVPHVHTDQTGGAVLPIRGVSNPDSPTARLETTDTGRNEFAYEGPFMPLLIKTACPSPSLFDYVKSGVMTLLASTASAYTESDRKMLAREVEHDIVAHRGFLLKAAFTNTAPIFIGNRLTGAVQKTGATVHATYTPTGAVPNAQTLDKHDKVEWSWGSNTPFGFALDPGESLFIEINRASNVYLYAESDQRMYWLSV